MAGGILGCPCLCCGASACSRSFSRCGNLRCPTSIFKTKPARLGRLFYFLLSDCCQGPKWILITPFTCNDGSLNRIESAKA